MFKRVLASRKQVEERLAQQRLRHLEIAAIPMLHFLYEDGSPEELQHPERVSDLEQIQTILEALDNKHQYL